MNILKVLFPALMVIGATGSLLTNVFTKGDFAMNMQWFGAALLYTALLIRNIS